MLMVSRFKDYRLTSTLRVRLVQARIHPESGLELVEICFFFYNILKGGKMGNGFPVPTIECLAYLRYSY